MIMINENKYKIYCEKIQNATDDVARNRVSICDRNGSEVFTCFDPIDLVQVAGIDQSVGGYKDQFVAVTLNPRNQTFGFLDSHGVSIENIRLPKALDQRVWLLQSDAAEENEVPRVILYDAAMRNSFHIPMFLGCSMEGIQLTEATYSVYGVPCLEVSVPVRFSHVEDCLTYIFCIDSIDISDPTSLRLFGVVSRELNSFIETCIPALNTREGGTITSPDVGILIDNKYIPQIKQRNVVLSQEKPKEIQDLLQKKLGSRFQSKFQKL